MLTLDYLGVGGSLVMGSRELSPAGDGRDEQKEEPEKPAGQEGLASCCWLEDGAGSVEVAEGGSCPTASKEKGPSAPQP